MKDTKEKSENLKAKTNRRKRRIKQEIKHSLIPEHIVSDESELINQNIDPEKIPFIYISDPAICHLDVKVGDIIKIVRKNPIVGNVIYYRQVVRA